VKVLKELDDAQKALHEALLSVVSRRLGHQLANGKFPNRDYSDAVAWLAETGQFDSVVKLTEMLAAFMEASANYQMHMRRPEVPPDEPTGEPEYLSFAESERVTRFSAEPDLYQRMNDWYLWATAGGMISPIVIPIDATSRAILTTETAQLDEYQWATGMENYARITFEFDGPGSPIDVIPSRGEWSWHNAIVFHEAVMKARALFDRLGPSNGA
jgi:hypothetical protein